MEGFTSSRPSFLELIVSIDLDKPAQVYVIDDDNEVRRSLHALLSTANMLSWPFSSADDFLDSLATLEPAPILLDVRMPMVDGIQLLTMLRQRGVEWPVIMMTAHGDIQVAVQSIKLGAIEFLEKPFEFEALDRALQMAFGQLAAINAAISARNAARRRLASLSAREREVLDVLAQGIPNKIAAHTLSLSVRTIEMHRARALAKLDVKSMVEVVRLASLVAQSPPKSDQDNDLTI